MRSFLILLAFSAGVIAFSCGSSAAPKADTGFAVVELFTSEGCSSCPPADAAAAALLKKYNSGVYVLGYHVDYWDGLGWKDVFSNPAYTTLQRQYAKAFKLSSVYTPQVVVNGMEQFVGSDAKKLDAAVDKNLHQTSRATLHIDAVAAAGNDINISYETDAANANLKIALVQLAATNKIQRGENTGATLHHVNVVRDIKTIQAPQKGVAIVKLPGNLKTSECSIIAFTQNISDNTITAATQTSIH